MSNVSPQRTYCHVLPGSGIIIGACVILTMLACSSKDDNSPVSPNGTYYDPEVMALIPTGSFQMGNITKYTKSPLRRIRSD